MVCSAIFSPYLMAEASDLSQWPLSYAFRAFSLSPFCFCKAMCFSPSLYFTLFHYSSQWFILSFNLSHPLHLFYIPPQDVLSVCLYYSLYHFYLHHCILVDHSIDSFGFCPNWNTTNYLVDSSFPGLLQLVSDSMYHHQSSHSDLVILIKDFYDRSLPPWLETSFNKFMKLHIYDVWATLEFLDQSTEGSFFSSTPMTSLLKKKKSKHSSSLMPSYTSNYSRG